MLDAVPLLGSSQSFTTKDNKQLKEWFGKFLQWILTSKQGQEEGQQKNNHSTAHDAQVIAFAMGTSTGSRKIQASNGRASIKAIVKGYCVASAKVQGIPVGFISISPQK